MYTSYFSEVCTSGIKYSSIRVVLRRRSWNSVVVSYGIERLHLLEHMLSWISVAWYECTCTCTSTTCACDTVLVLNYTRDREITTTSTETGYQTPRLFWPSNNLLFGILHIQFYPVMPGSCYRLLKGYGMPNG